MMAAVTFAREIGTPLNAHATIHWVGTEVGDDPNGERFAKVREGFDKWLKRQNVVGGLTAVWVRERLSGEPQEENTLQVLMSPNDLAIAAKMGVCQSALSELLSHDLRWTDLR
jgi:hypothetical protein